MKVVLIPGDGIGPEVAAAAQEVVAAAGVRIEWEVAHAGVAAAERFGDPLPEATLEAVRRHRVALKGPCTTPIGKGFRSINVRLRQGLDLYASVRPVRTLPGVKVPYRASTWSWCARTPRGSTPASSTSWCRGWSRACAS